MAVTGGNFENRLRFDEVTAMSLVAPRPSHTASTFKVKVTTLKAKVKA